MCMAFPLVQLPKKFKDCWLVMHLVPMTPVSISSTSEEVQSSEGTSESIKLNVSISSTSEEVQSHFLLQG